VASGALDAAGSGALDAALLSSPGAARGLHVASGALDGAGSGALDGAGSGALDGAGSGALDGAGSGALDGPSVSRRAPGSRSTRNPWPATASELAGFALTVTDACGAAAIDTISIIIVRNRAAPCPRA
jgi:hypothetical protein